MKSFENNRIVSFTLGLFLFLFFLKLSECLYPHEHGDALYYHLVGPKIWYQYSWNEMWKDLVLFVHAGIFDYFFIIPFYFFSSLLAIQIAGQLMHFLFSLGIGSVMLLKEFTNPLWALMAAISLLTISRDSAFFFYAKNDGILAVTGLVTFLFIKKDEMNPKNSMKIGFFLSLVVAVKMNGVFNSFIFFLYYCYRHYHRKGFVKNLSILIGCAILAVLPVLFKNYYYIGNPVFPALLKQMPGKTSTPMFHHYTLYYGNPMGMDMFFIQLGDFFMGKILFLITPLLFVYNIIKKRFSLNAAYLLAVGIFALYLYFNGSLQQTRYFFTCYFLIIYFIFESLEAMTTRDNLQTHAKNALYLVILILVLVDSKIDKSMSHFKEVIELNRNHTEKEILRLKIPFSAFYDDVVKDPHERITYILSDNLSDSYYLPNGVRLHTAVLTPEASFLFECKTSQDTHRLLKYRYAILLENRENPCYQQILSMGKKLREIRGYTLYQLR